jgi:glycerate 2-kinase
VEATTGWEAVLAAPDSFKGSASAHEVAAAVAAGAEAAGRRCDQCPLSDGGEGFADVLSVLGGERRRTVVTGPAGRPVEAGWRLVGDLAVVESAQASGLVVAGGAAGNDPEAATSRGTGELIVAARGAGAGRILVGLGGSATTDGGWGAVEAIEAAGGLQGIEVDVACDTVVPFRAAAAVFAPQKGATPSQVEGLTGRLDELAIRYRHRYGVDVDAIAGSGAAGGLAGGLAALGARLEPGFEVVARAVGLEARLKGAAVVVTGEGQLDATSWTGKVVGSLAGRAVRLGVPLLVVAGVVTPEGRAGAASGLQLVDLTERFGPDRARSQVAACVTEVVAGTLGGPA